MRLFPKRSSKQQRPLSLNAQRIADIDRRFAVVDAELTQYDPAAPVTYRQQELRAEQTDLLRLRRETLLAEEDRLHPPRHDPRLPATVDALVRESEEVHDAWISKLEAQGDYRNSRLWRMQRMHIREQVERELGVRP